jgi:hypothetical protein
MTALTEGRPWTDPPVVNETPGSSAPASTGKSPLAASTASLLGSCCATEPALGASVSDGARATAHSHAADRGGVPIGRRCGWLGEGGEGRGNGDGVQHPWELSLYLVDAGVVLNEMLYLLQMCSFVYFIIFICNNHCLFPSQQVLTL